MKKIFLAFIIGSALVSCKKETNTPTTNGNSNTIDTIKTSTNDVSITSFDCSGVKIAGTLTKDKVASNVTATLTYTGGNGKTYLTKSHTSKGVSGLTANLLAGTLANGEGTLVYTISGTPTTSGIASFAIVLGGKTCTINIKVEDVAQIIGKPGPNITDVEGNSYKTVTIGSQTWMAENLKTSKYNDGSLITHVKDSLEWIKLTTGAWSYYNNDEKNNSKYGKLYNWYAISVTTNGDKNVCPSGWHVPSADEWKVLINYLGGEYFAGNKMKEVGTNSWISPNTEATNISLFSAIPSGTRDYEGKYGGLGSSCHWWASIATSCEIGWGLRNSSSWVEKGCWGKFFGLSVRCLKD